MRECPFYLVWREGGGSPTHKHPDRETADREAERLARSTPGESFYVVAPMSRVRKTDVEREFFMVDDDGVPF